MATETGGRDRTGTGVQGPATGRGRRFVRVLLIGLGMLLGLVLAAAAAGGFWLRSELKGSLPVLDGEAAIAGLAAPVRIDRDRLGIPTIVAANRLDLARATGFLHAQERFFQMDLMRRRAAGELAEIFGKAALPLDRASRVHRLRAVARKVIGQAGAGERRLIEAYAEGVNAGLSALRVKPFEYVAVRAEPAPWKPEDSALVLLSMFLELQDETGSRESAMGVMADTLPPAMCAFLAPAGTEWDAPLVGGAFETPPVPGAEIFRVRREDTDQVPKDADRSRPSIVLSQPHDEPEPLHADGRARGRGRGPSSLPVELPTSVAADLREHEQGLDGNRLPQTQRPGEPMRRVFPETQRRAEFLEEIFPGSEPVLSPLDERHDAGSNNWAVAGSRTQDGRAILANDMHLALAVPNTWYRASFVWPEEGGSASEGRRTVGEGPPSVHAARVRNSGSTPGTAATSAAPERAEPRADGPGGTGESGPAAQRVTGLTLPGTPAMVVGSNTRIAWGFTNTQGDWSDLVVIEVDPRNPGAYLTPEGPRDFQRERETIHVKGGSDETMEVVSTIWGPIVDKDHLGRPRALRWVAHDSAAVDFRLLALETARGVEDALALAAEGGIPAQNILVADASGRIGWTVCGRIPRRRGFDGRLPASWADGARRWDGWLAPAEYPRVVDPPSGQLWTANARTLEGSALGLLGDGGYALGARARQIRDDLAALHEASEQALLAIQLDDRALFLARWRRLLLDALTAEAIAADPRRGELEKCVEDWQGRASVDSVGYRMVRAFRLALANQVLGALTSPCKKADARFDIGAIGQYEGPLWRLVNERPPHLLSPRYADWQAQMMAAVDEVLDACLKQGPRLAERTWGECNAASIRHPLSRAVPALARWLDMPAEPLPGDSNMPRVQSPAFGASERMVVSPGREEEGFLEMPCGESGHPLSAHYKDGHAAWVRGEATPFLPGPALHTLVLRPMTRSSAR